MPGVCHGGACLEFPWFWGAGYFMSGTQGDIGNSLGLWSPWRGFSLLGTVLAEGPPSVSAGKVSWVSARSLGQKGQWDTWGSVIQTGLFPWIVVLYLFPLIYISCLFIQCKDLIKCI